MSITAYENIEDINKKINDEIKIIGDSDSSRFFEVVGVNDLTSNAVFLTIHLKERHD